jgi:hypothetical protein
MDFESYVEWREDLVSDRSTKMGRTLALTLIQHQIRSLSIRLITARLNTVYFLQQQNHLHLEDPSRYDRFLQKLSRFIRRMLKLDSEVEEAIEEGVAETNVLQSGVDLNEEM